MKDNIFIMYAALNHAYKFINYELPLTHGTETPILVGKTLNLNHVTTTNTVHNEKLINRNRFLYKYLLPTARDKKIQSLQISLILGMVPPKSQKDQFMGESMGATSEGDEYLKSSYIDGDLKPPIPL